MKILITGATSGIGKQLALDYNQDGHEVWAVGRNTTALAELEDLGMHGVALDLDNRDATLAWCRQLESIDLAILNAGTCEYLDMPEFDSSLFARVFRANVLAMANCIEGLLPALRRGHRPHLVCTGSSAAYLPLPRAEAYGASKAAVAYLCDTLRITLKPSGIDVSLVCPGFVATPLTDKNDFPMPVRISTKEASQAIRRGITRRQAEIHFPKRFTLTLKLLALLPRRIWAAIAQRMIRS